MQRLPAPFDIPDPLDLKYHWGWLYIFIERAIANLPVPGQASTFDTALFKRLTLMVQAAEAIARRILILLAMTLAPTTPRTTRRRAPAPTILLPVFGLIPDSPRRAENANSLMPLTESFPGPCTHTQSAASPLARQPGLPPNDALKWARLMLRLSRVKRLLIDHDKAAAAMRRHIDARAMPPVPLINPPLLCHPLLDDDVRPLATYANALAADALYPDGEPPG